MLLACYRVEVILKNWSMDHTLIFPGSGTVVGIAAVHLESNQVRGSAPRFSSPQQVILTQVRSWPPC